MFRSLAVVIAILTPQAALAQTTGASEPPDGLTWMVLNEINGDYFNRAEPMNHPPFISEPPAGMITPVDVSQDGATDWLIDYSAAGRSSWCGTGGCLATLYVSDGEDYVMALDRQVIAFDVHEADGGRRVEVQVHHGDCIPDDDECRYAFTWDPELKRLIEAPTRAGVTRLAPGLTPIVGWERTPDVRTDVPAEVASAWRVTRVTCPSTADAGFEARWGDLRDTPDLNGDGRRDWVLQPPYPCDDLDGEPRPASGFEVYVTRGEDAAEHAFRSEPEHWAAIDVSTTPATLLDTASCAYGTACADRRLRWDGQTFVED